MMKSKNTLAVLTMLGACGVAQAQGYFDFDSVPGLPEQPSVQLDLNAAMIGIAAAASSAAHGADPAVAALLQGIEGVRVRAYPTLENAGAVTSFINDASGRLESGGWERVVYVQDGADNVRVYARMDGDVMNGLTIMALSEEAAAFVNVAGRISAEQFGRIASTIDADDLLGGMPQLALGQLTRSP
jgi:hypothetical protein